MCKELRVPVANFKAININKAIQYPAQVATQLITLFRTFTLYRQEKFNDEYCRIAYEPVKSYVLYSVTMMIRTHNTTVSFTSCTKNVAGDSNLFSTEQIIILHERKHNLP